MHTQAKKNHRQAMVQLFHRVFLLENFNQKEFLRFAVSYMVFEESVMALALHDTKLVTFLILSCEEKIKFVS